MFRSLEWIAAATDGETYLRGTGEDVVSSGVDVALATTDSRECVAGSLYFARVGETSDGHTYIGQAATAGAVAAVVEHASDSVSIPQIVVDDSTIALGRLAKAHLVDLRSSGPIRVAGVTGSAGKTTVKDLLARILAKSGPTVAPIASFNNEVGCPLTILKADNDTRFMVLEMGASGPGHIRYLTEIAPLDAAVELMVGRAHLGGYASFDSLVETKRELVEGLLPGGVGVLNADDPAVAGMVSAVPGEVCFFSAAGSDDASIRAVSVTIEPDGAPSFVLETPDFRGRLKLCLVGVHQVSNALAAVACNFVLGQSTITAVRELEVAGAVSPHRMDIREDVRILAADGKESVVTIIDDAYNANPDSMAASFAAATSIRNGRRLIMVLGEMLELGEQSEDIHREVGRAAAAANPDGVITVGLGASPLQEALGVDVAKVAEEDAEGALVALKGVLQDGDLVLLKGSYGSGVWKVANALCGAA